MALLIGCLALFLAAGYWLMGRVDAAIAVSFGLHPQQMV